MGPQIGRSGRAVWDPRAGGDEESARCPRAGLRRAWEVGGAGPTGARHTRRSAMSTSIITQHAAGTAAAAAAVVAIALGGVAFAIAHDSGGAVVPTDPGQSAV